MSLTAIPYAAFEFKNDDSGKALFHALKALDPTLDELQWSDVVDCFLICHFPSFGRYTIELPAYLSEEVVIRPGEVIGLRTIENP